MTHQKIMNIEMNKLSLRIASSNAFLYGVLLLFVWGLTAAFTGFWQDDIVLMRIAAAHRHEGLSGWLANAGTPTRRLYLMPFHLALLTPHPVWTVELVYGIAWLVSALAAGCVVRQMIPHRPLIQLLTVVLALTATSDYLTNNMTSIGYQVAVAAFFTSLACAIRYLQRGGFGWAIGSAITLATSLWTIDTAIPVLPTAALIVALQARRATKQRLILLGTMLLVVLAPYAIAEWRFLHDPTSYASGAFTTLPKDVLLKRIAGHWLLNFAPWRWPLSRSVWYPRPPAVIPVWLMLVLAAAAAALVALRIARIVESRAAEPDDSILKLEHFLGVRLVDTAPASDLAVPALFALTALLANAVYARLIMADIHYRTHVMSRVWASMAIASAIAWAAARWPHKRALIPILTIPVAFVAFGVWGGLERQDLFLSTWHQHKRELGSILDAAPSLRPGTGILLRGDGRPERYLATEADYLSASWLALLYRREPPHSLKISVMRQTGCRATPRGLDCWHEQEARCFAEGSCAPDHFDYDKVVVMDFDRAAGMFRLLPTLRGDVLASGAEGAERAYKPQDRIVVRPLSEMQKRLLLKF